MQSNHKGTQTYFDRVPNQWDALYSHENRVKYLINRWLRKGMFRRYKFTFEHCGDLTGARVLDIGCGTGRYSIECAKRGASHVVGIDFAPSMIEFSRQIARQMGVTDKCEFICDNFLEHSFEDYFDFVIAVGFFDYIKDPEPYFRKIAQFKPRKFVASFPRFTPLWGTQRKIRYYWIKKCPIYNYTEEQLVNLYREAPFANYQILGNKRGFFCAAGV